jgi:hypothetical protein
MKKLSFSKEDGNWYINLKFWPGPKSALEMVQGADRLLDQLSQNTNHVKLKVYETPQDDALKVSLITPNKLTNGGNYTIKGPQGFPKKMWLCNVTRFVYLGRMPKELYIKACQ